MFICMGIAAETVSVIVKIQTKLTVRAFVVLTNGKNGIIGRQILPMVPLVIPMVIPMVPLAAEKHSGFSGYHW